MSEDLSIEEKILASAQEAKAGEIQNKLLCNKFGLANQVSLPIYLAAENLVDDIIGIMFGYIGINIAVNTNKDVLKEIREHVEQIPNILIGFTEELVQMRINQEKAKNENLH